MPEICRICREAPATLSYEHVPPRAAFNDEPTTVYGLADWLAREEDGQMRGGRIEQRGAGASTLCARCNNNTGSWYGTELALAARRRDDSARGTSRRFRCNDRTALRAYRRQANAN